MVRTRRARRRELLAGAASLLAAGPALAHGGGDGGGGGGEGGGGGLSDVWGTPLTLGDAGWYSPPGLEPPQPPEGIAAGTAGLGPLSPAEQAAWDAWIAGLEGQIWGGLESVAKGLDWLGSWTQYGLNFVPGLSEVNVGLTGGRSFAEAYSQALDRGASQLEAIKAGMKAGAIGAGLDILGGKLTGKGADQTFKNARDAFATMKQVGAPTPKGVSKFFTNAAGYGLTIAGTEKGKELGLPTLIGTADQFADALGKSVPNQTPPSGGGWLPGHSVPAAR